MNTAQLFITAVEPNFDAVVVRYRIVCGSQTISDMKRFGTVAEMSGDTIRDFILTEAARIEELYNRAEDIAALPPNLDLVSYNRLLSQGVDSGVALQQSLVG